MLGWWNDVPIMSLSASGASVRLSQLLKDKAESYPDFYFPDSESGGASFNYFPIADLVRANPSDDSVFLKYGNMSHNSCSVPRQN